MMRDDKLIELFEFYTREAMPGQLPRRLGDTSYFSRGDILTRLAQCQHAAWMATQAIGFIKEAQRFDSGSRVEGLPELTNWEEAHNARSKREKAHRWLGFIQGVLWMAGRFTLDDLKEHSRKCSDDYEETKDV